MGHVARAPWDMLRRLHRTCCEGSIGHVVRAPWDMLRGLHGTCCEGSTYIVETKGSNSFRGLRGRSVPRVARALLGTRGLKLVDPVGQGI